MITSEMLAKQRLEFAGSYQELEEIRREANYYAPSQWTMYTWEDGDQHLLWNNRYGDGEIWSAFKRRDIANSAWWGSFLSGNREY